MQLSLSRATFHILAGWTAALGLAAIGDRLRAADDAPPRQGFSEPYRVINVASAESGTLDVLSVRLGDRVREGQPLASLDMAVHQTLVEIARANKEAEGELVAARAERRVREHRLEKMSELHRSSFASDEELERAQADLDIVRAQVQTAEERREMRELEYAKLQAQLQARTIRAPQDGVITRIFKHRGEYVGPNDPAVFQLVQLDPLAVVFLLPWDEVQDLAVDQKVQVSFLSVKRPVPGTIEFVSPMVEAGSGTVTVRVRVENPDGSLWAGEPCEWLGGAKAETGAAVSRAKLPRALP
jgi:RND family efflux transporter MFP subunit